MRKALFLDDIPSWPEAVVTRLAQKASKIRKEILADKKYSFLPSIDRIKRPPPAMEEYKRTHSFVKHEISELCLRAYHCCRLEEEDVEKIKSEGLKRLDPFERVEALKRVVVKVPELRGTIRHLQRLLDEQTTLIQIVQNRRYVCFVPAKRCINSGCDPLFDHWGGEYARRVLQELDPSLCEHLKKLGRPYVIEADVPVTWLASWNDVAGAMIRLFVIDRFKDDIDPGFFDVFVAEDIPARSIVEICPFANAKQKRKFGPKTKVGRKPRHA
jgi:hypothetical protein